MAGRSWLRALISKDVIVDSVEMFRRRKLHLKAGPGIKLTPSDSSSKDESIVAVALADETPSATVEISGGLVEYDALQLTGSIPLVELSAESGTADVLQNITGASAGKCIALRPKLAHYITVDAVGGNIELDGKIDCLLTQPNDVLVLLFDGTNWIEIGRSYGTTYVNATGASSHTLNRIDCNRKAGIASTGATTFTLTIDEVSGTAYPVGTRIPLAKLGAGDVVVDMTGAATLNGTSGAAALTISTQYSQVILWHRATDVWVALTS